MSPALAPGSRIGVLGGGQLGRMLAVAAARLGFDVHIFAPEPDAPAFRVAARTTQAGFDDLAALRAFAADVDVVTYEFENVPATAVAALEEAGVRVRPGGAALAASQDRAAEKRFLAGCGVETVAFAVIDGPEDIAPALTRLRAPALLKTRRLGYDGKGQAWVRDAADAPAAWAAIGAAPAILEAKANFVAEVSIVAARGADGTFAAYPMAHNRHEAGVLRESAAPAQVGDEAAATARAAAQAAMAALDYVGVLAIEFFVMADGRLIANEMAPRVHNSGHWTADACVCGQFEQHIRAVAGWPLGSTALLHDRVVMRNLLGEEQDAWARLASDPHAVVTLYGKRDAAPGRKMGHVTWLERDGG